MRGTALRFGSVVFMAALTGLLGCPSGGKGGMPGCGDGQPALDCQRGHHERDGQCVPNEAPQASGPQDGSAPVFGR